MTINYTQFKDKDKARANTLVSYYEGDQLRFVKKILDGKMEGMGARKDWKERGFIPRTRNITKSIVDKSGLLMNKPPKLEIWKDGSVTPVLDETFNLLMYNSDWLEFFQNVDVYTRLLKTTVVLAQKYLPETVTTQNGVYRYNEDRGDALVLTLLHEGNSCIEQDIARNITELAYYIDPEPEWIQSDDDKKEVWYYRRITPVLISDYRVEQGVGEEIKETLMNEEVNIEGIVPAVVFYDVNRPRKGVWARTPEDLPSLQEFYNLHLTDQEFAIAHQKQKTLFVDAEIESSQDGAAVVPYAPSGYAEAGEVYRDLESVVNGKEAKVGGLGSIVKLKSDGTGKTPFVEFKGPETDLASLDKIAADLVVTVAHDWDVNLRVEGSGNADSGFKLVVEEMNNLQLREKRAQSFQAGFRKFYSMLRVLYPELTEGTLLVEFAPPSLPVNHKEQEEMWEIKINSGRASRIDYFIEVHQMSREEAESKIAEIDAYNESLANNLNTVNIPDFNEEV